MYAITESLIEPLEQMASRNVLGARAVGGRNMTTAKKTIDPPTDPPTYEMVVAESKQMKVDMIAMEARLAVHENANAARLAIAMADPARDFQILGEACFRTGVRSKTAWAWFDKGLIYGFYIEGTTAIKLCVNDLDDKNHKRGRHG